MAEQPLQAILAKVRQAALRQEGGALGDAQLLERFVRDRDEAAFELLVWRHERMVMSVCRRVIGDVHEAEDAFQGVFLVLARKAGSVSRREALASWLYRVAYRVALRARARLAKRPGGPPLPTELSENAAADTSMPQWTDLEPILDQAIHGLPEKYRAPLILCYLEGKTYDEAAAVLRCPKGTISTRLTRARELLRTRLGCRGVSLTGAALAAVLVEQAAAGAARATLVQTTLTTALAGCQGSLAAGVVPASVASLAQGVWTAMFLSKLKISAALLLTVGLAGAGIWTVAQPGIAGQNAAPATPEIAAPPSQLVAVQDKQQPIDKVPEPVKGIRGEVVGKVISADHEKGSLVLEIRHVKNVWKASKAKDPYACLGKTLKVEKVFGKFLDVLLTLKEGDGVMVEIKHDAGDNLAFLGEVLQRTDLPPTIIRPKDKKKREKD